MNHKFKIAFFGSSLVSAYWNGAATYYRGLIRQLHANGHQIIFYEPDAFDRQQHRDIEDPPYAQVVLYQPHEEDAYRMLTLARDSDVMIKASGVGVLDDFLERAILEEKRADTCAIFWDVDAPATLERVHSNPVDPFHALIPRYDLILTYGGGDPVVREYTMLGAQKCVPIYNALDPTTHYPVLRDPRFDADLAFLGNRMPDREQRVEEFFLTPASIAPAGKTFLLGGSGWENRHLPSNVKYVGHVYTKDHNAFNCTPSVVLNVNRTSMARYGFSPPTRIFEAAGAGAAIITDAWQGIDLFLEPGKEVLVAAGGEEVSQYIAKLSPNRCRAIGAAAYRRVLSEHTYQHRANQFDLLMADRGVLV